MRFQRTLIGAGELLFLLRPLWCVIAVVFFGQSVGLLPPAWAAPAPTITTLSVTSGGNAVTTVSSGSVVALTATVMTGSTPVTPGQVNFCDATAKLCTDIHLLGTAQLTANGTATLKFRPGVGSHSYQAVLAEPAAVGTSASTASSLTVTASQGTGQLATTTYLEASGVPNIFSLTATVPGNGIASPTGMVSFVDASNGNAVLGTAALTSETGAGFAGSSLLTAASQNNGNTVLTADFNGDGIPDLVILGGEICVLLGNGDGTFTAAPNPPDGLPGAIAVGDFNGDGIPDVAVVPILDEGYSEVLLGKGDGTFTSVRGGWGFGFNNGTITSDSIAVGDFNGDGKLDLAETCVILNDQPCNSLLIQFGNGDGTFTQSSGSQLSLVFSGSQSMAVGDFNGDGKPDLAVTNSGANGVNVFLNSGGGLSAVSAIPATGESPSSIAAADFNGDGKLDLAVANSGSSNVTILLGNGDGTFTAAASPATGTAPNSVAVADFNGDGVPDLAVANAGSSNVTILLGNGDGTFTTVPGPAADTGSTSVIAADFNGDGKEDLVVANAPDSSATTLLAETALATATVNNISPVGVGTHLAKAIYSGDVNYGGSTSADVPLLVVSPGFTLSSTPVSVVAGATGTSTLTITPTNGFSGTVALFCDGSGFTGVVNFNAVPTCASIPSVTISGNAPATTTLSIQTQPDTTPGQGLYVEYVYAVDSSGKVNAHTDVAVSVTAPTPSFTLTNTAVSIATPGASGTSTITISPSSGFTGSVALSCTVYAPTAAVDQPTCSVAAPPAITGTAAVTATLTVNTTAASSSSNATARAATAFRKQHDRMLALGGGGALVAFLFFELPSRRRRTKTLLSLLLLGAFATTVIGCGGAQKAANPVATPANPGTTAGSYLVTVTGSSGALTASTTVAVTLN